MKFVDHTPETASPRASEVLKARKEPLDSYPTCSAYRPRCLSAVVLYRPDRIIGQSQHECGRATGYENSCGYCMAAHSTVAGMTAIPETVLKALRSGVNLPDRNSRHCARSQSTWPDLGDACPVNGLKSFSRHGIAGKSLGGCLCRFHEKIEHYVSHITETPVDAQFTQHAWELRSKSA